VTRKINKYENTVTMLRCAYRVAKSDVAEAGWQWCSDDKS